MSVRSWRGPRCPLAFVTSSPPIEDALWLCGWVWLSVLLAGLTETILVHTAGLTETILDTQKCLTEVFFLFFFSRHKGLYNIYSLEQ